MTRTTTPRWKRTGDYYVRSDVPGLVCRKGTELAGLCHDATRRVTWHDGVPGWVYVAGLHACGVFPTLAQAQRWAVRNCRRAQPA